jgi:hypothetical protein
MFEGGPSRPPVKTSLVGVSQVEDTLLALISKAGDYRKMGL